MGPWPSAVTGSAAGPHSPPATLTPILSAPLRFPVAESLSADHMYTLRAFFSIVDLHTITVSVLAVISTFVANRFDLAAEMPTTIISIAVIFPIVFSINAAYTRREEALLYLSSFRSHLAGIFYGHRDWLPGADAHAERGRERVRSTLAELEAYLADSASGSRNSAERLYAEFSLMSSSLEELREGGLSGSEVSRLNQYLRGLIHDFERIRNITAYRTPVPLRAYSHVFLNSFPIVFGPYFAWLGASYYPVVGYAVAFLYAVVLVSLDNIQEQLENPFDSVGADDIRLDEAERFAATLAPAASPL